MNKKNQPGLFGEVLSSKEPAGYAEMYCDGACSGNPGHSGLGVVISLDDNDAQLPGQKKNYEISEYIGIATNNIAEYSALIRGLEKAKSLGIRKIKVFLDSELIVRQISGVYKVKNEKLILLYNNVRALLEYFETYKITHVRREFNKKADELARNGAAGYR